MADTTIVELEEALRKKKFMRTRELLTMLKSPQFGFTCAEGGKGSHINCFNLDYPEIGRFTIIHGTKKIDSTKTVLNALLQYLRIKEAEQATHQDLVEAFTKTIEPERKLHKNFEIFHDTRTNTYFLRHKEYPQTGIAIGSDPNVDLEIYQSIVENTALNLAVAIDTACKDYDFEVIDYPNGTKLLRNIAYNDIAVLLPPLTSRTENNNDSLISDVERITEQVMHRAVRNGEIIEDYKKTFGLEEVSSDSPTMRKFNHRDPFVPSNITTISLPTTPSGLISYADFKNFALQASNVNWKDIRNKFKEYFGFESRKQGDVYKFKHALYDIEFDVPASLVEDFPENPDEDTFDALSTEERTAYLSRLQEWSQDRVDITSSFKDGQKKSVEVAAANLQKLAAIEGKYGLTRVPSSKVKLGTSSFRYKYGDYSIACHGYFVNNFTGSGHAFLMTEQQISDFEDKLKDAKPKTPTAGKFGEATASQPLPGLPGSPLTDKPNRPKPGSGTLPGLGGGAWKPPKND